MKCETSLLCIIISIIDIILMDTSCGIMATCLEHCMANPCAEFDRLSCAVDDPAKVDESIQAACSYASGGPSSSKLDIIVQSEAKHGRLFKSETNLISDQEGAWKPRFMCSGSGCTDASFIVVGHNHDTAFIPVKGCVLECGLLI